MYDVIGDIHGCRLELHQLLKKLGYKQSSNSLYHPGNRIPVFIGDVTDRGPDSLGTVSDVAGWVGKEQALYCPGNHCDKLYRFFLGRNVQITNGLETTIAEWKGLSPSGQKDISRTFRRLYENSPLYLMLDNNRLVTAHAGIRYQDIGRSGRSIKSFVLYGDVTGEKDQKGLPVRRDWPNLYPQGKAVIVYGHTPVRAPRVVGRTINIDTGCVFGGSLTAYRYPEGLFESVSSTLPENPEKFLNFPQP